MVVWVVMNFEQLQKYAWLATKINSGTILAGIFDQLTNSAFFSYQIFAGKISGLTNNKIISWMSSFNTNVTNF
jgi:hypothetical protein